MFWQNLLQSRHTHHILYQKEPHCDVVNEAHHFNGLWNGVSKVPGFAAYFYLPHKIVCIFSGVYAGDCY